MMRQAVVTVDAKGARTSLVESVSTAPPESDTDLDDDSRRARALKEIEFERLAHAHRKRQLLVDRTADMIGGEHEGGSSSMTGRGAAGGSVIGR